MRTKNTSWFVVAGILILVIAGILLLALDPFGEDPPEEETSAGASSAHESQSAGNPVVSSEPTTEPEAGGTTDSGGNHEPDNTPIDSNRDSSVTTEPPSESIPVYSTDNEHVHASAGTRTVITEATCTQTGTIETIEICACGFEISKTITEIPATGHVYQSKTTNPTCLDDGFIEYTCSVCKDSYTEQSESLHALGHNYLNGVCTRCKAEDPDYVKVYSSKEIMAMLEQAKVNSTSGFDFRGSEPISVFAKDRSNCFTFRTAVSYNLWGHEVQSVVFNVEEICEVIPTLYFSVGGADGSSGSMLVEFFVDSTTDEQATESFELECSAYPLQSSINIENAKSLVIRVRNKSGNENVVVFYDFSSAAY